MQSDMPDYKISIIIPVYNAELYLKQCLQSVINQTFENWEIIAINDGSKDNSEKILKEFIRTDNRIKYINQENAGASEARKRGINLAQGKYIVFLDSDDWLSEDALKLMYNRCVNENLDFLECTFTMYSEQFTYQTRHKYNGIVDGLSFLEACADNEENIAITCAMSKKALWIDNSIYLPNNLILPNEDLYPLFHIWNKIKRAEIRSDWPIYYYRYNPMSATATGKLLRNQKLWSKYFNLVRDTLSNFYIPQSVEHHLRMREINNFGFFINPINVHDEWYRKVISYDVSCYPIKIKVLHKLIRHPRFCKFVIHTYRNIQKWGLKIRFKNKVEQ